VPGNSLSSLKATLDPSISYYLLDIHKVMTKTLLADGDYGFNMNVYYLLEDYYQLWEARGITYSTDPPLLRLIITGDSPMFYLHVTTDADGVKQYMLVDGYLRDSEQGDQWLRVDGNYPLGHYELRASLQTTYDAIVHIEFQAPH